MRAGRWHGNVFILDSSVAGVICTTANGQWEAAGCYCEWMDVELDTWETKAEAKLAIERWVVGAGETDEN